MLAYPAIIFLPVELNSYEQIFLHGDLEKSESSIDVYVTGTCQTQCGSCIGFYSKNKSLEKIDLSYGRWIHIEKSGAGLLLKKIIINGQVKDCKGHAVVIYYDRRVFFESGDTCLNHVDDKSLKIDHFHILTKKLHLQMNNRSKVSVNDCIQFLTFFKCFIILLSSLSRKLLPFIKYSNIAIHINGYITGLLWMTDLDKEDGRNHIKKFNFIFATFADIILGSLSLYWLTLQCSSDSFPTFFLIAADRIVQSLRDTIHWLTGDPAGFKLNYTFSKILATFFLYYINIWYTFLALLKPAYKIMFQVFLILGKFGITFQLSVISDLLVVVSFHIYSICIFAARLYNIQISALLALWRLFLGRKKNPLRGRVDSCKYSPEQLFIGTLGFTILLFLLPTTLIYYVVFTSMRILLTAFAGILSRLQYIVHTLPIYSTFLWLVRSPKVAAGFEITPQDTYSKDHCLIFHIKPVSSSWWDTVLRCKPDFIKKPKDVNIINFVSFILTGAIK